MKVQQFSTEKEKRKIRDVLIRCTRETGAGYSVIFLDFLFHLPKDWWDKSIERHQRIMKLLSNIMNSCLKNKNVRLKNLCPWHAVPFVRKDFSINKHAWPWELFELSFALYIFMYNKGLQLCEICPWRKQRSLMYLVKVWLLEPKFVAMSVRVFIWEKKK